MKVFRFGTCAALCLALALVAVPVVAQGPYTQSGQVNSPNANATISGANFQQAGPTCTYIATGTPVSLDFGGLPGAEWLAVFSLAMTPGAVTLPDGQKVDVDLSQILLIASSPGYGTGFPVPALSGAGSFSIPLAWPAPPTAIIYQCAMADASALLGIRLSAAIDARSMNPISPTQQPTINGRFIYAQTSTTCNRGVRDSGDTNFGPSGTQFSVLSRTATVQNDGVDVFQADMPTAMQADLQQDDTLLGLAPLQIDFVRPDRIFLTYLGSTFSGNVRVTNNANNLCYLDGADAGQSWFSKTEAMAGWSAEVADAPGNSTTPYTVNAGETFHGTLLSAADVDEIILPGSQYADGQKVHVELYTIDLNGSGDPLNPNSLVSVPIVTCSASAYGTTSIPCAPFVEACPWNLFYNIVTGVATGYDAEDTYLEIEAITSGVGTLVSANDDGGIGTASRIGGVGNGAGGAFTGTPVCNPTGINQNGQGEKTVYGQATCPTGGDPYAPYTIVDKVNFENDLGIRVSVFPNPTPGASVYPQHYIVTVQVTGP